VETAAKVVAAIERQRATIETVNFMIEDLKIAERFSGR